MGGNMRHLVRGLAYRACSVALLALLQIPLALAAPVQVVVTATVTDVSRPTSPFTSDPYAQLAVGDTITGGLIYDTSTPYGPAPLSCFCFGYTFGGMSFTNNDGWSGGGGFGYANFTQDTGLASFNSPGDTRYASSFPSVSFFMNLFFDPYSFNGIPPAHLDFDAFVRGSIFGSYVRIPVEGYDASFSANVTSAAGVSPIPIPAAGWLFVSALGAPIGVRRLTRGRSWSPPAA